MTYIDTDGTLKDWCKLHGNFTIFYNTRCPLCPPVRVVVDYRQLRVEAEIAERADMWEMKL